MTQGDGQGVGHVGRLGRGGQLQLALDRLLHLRLGARPLPVSTFLICVAE